MMGPYRSEVCEIIWEADDAECQECGAPSDACKRNREAHGVHLRRPNYAE